MKYHHTKEKIDMVWAFNLTAETPARNALKAFLNPVKKPPGRQKTMWVSQVLKEIKLLTNLLLKDDITKKNEVLEAEACNFIKKETLAQVFSCEFCKIFKDTFLCRTPLGNWLCRLTNMQ